MGISAVIITRNEGHIIGKTLQSVRGVADEIIIVDSGSTDDTLDICRQHGARIIETGWDGYGPNKNKGIDAAKNDWILNLDADEVIDEALRTALLVLQPADSAAVFEMRFKNFFLEKWIRHGEWGNDKHIRLFNRERVRWNDQAVHEGLGLPDGATIILLKGWILHYTVHSAAEYEEKTLQYAKLNAQKYFEQKKRGTVIKQYLAPVFSFLKNYFFKLGFLDGKEGLLIARTTARYTYLKYTYLNQMIRQQDTRSKTN